MRSVWGYFAATPRMLKKAIQRGRRRVKTGGVALPPPNPELSEQLFSREGYVEDCDEPRTKLGALFSVLLSLFDRFFEQRPVGLCIEGLHGLTFCKIARDADFF